MRRFLEVVETRYLRHLPYILGAMTFFVCAAFLAAALLHIRNSRPSSPPIADTAQIVVFERMDCDTCDTFRARIAKPHQSSDLGQKLPLRYYDVTDSPPPKRFTLNRDIGSSPTVVVFDIFGREQGRIDWMPNSLADFQDRMRPHVRRAERDLEFVASR